MMSESDYPLRPKYFKRLPGMARTWESDPDELPYTEKLLTTLFLNVETDPLTHGPLVSNSHGTLEEILFVLPDFMLTDNAFLPVPLFLLKHLPEYSKVTIMTHKTSESRLKEILNKESIVRKVKLVTVPDHIEITPWAADPFITADGKKPVILEPFIFGRKDDQLISWYLEKKGIVERRRLPLYFEGGNILSGDDFFIVGTDYLVRTQKILHDAGVDSSPESVLSDFQNLDPSRKMIVLGTTLLINSQSERRITINEEEWKEVIYPKNSSGTSQPMFHVDMFLSVLGKNEDGKNRVMVGDPSLAADILQMALTSQMMKEAFDEIADELVHSGFEVWRNPLPLIYLDDEEEKTRHWYFASANNALIEINGANKKVWMPVFGNDVWPELYKTDQVNKELWQKAGFEVFELPDCHPFAEDNGVVHCIVKFLKRG